MIGITSKPLHTTQPLMDLSKLGVLGCILVCQLLTACASHALSDDDTAPTVAATSVKAGNKIIIAHNLQHDFIGRIAKNWHVPANTTGKQVSVRVKLNNNGQINSIAITHSSGDPVYDRSIVTAIRATAPFPMPDDPVARKQVRSFNSIFTS